MLWSLSSNTSPHLFSPRKHHRLAAVDTWRSWWWPGSGRQAADIHINSLEISAVFIALLPFQDKSFGHSIVLMTDNSSVMAYLNYQVGKVSLSVCQLTQQILSWAELLIINIPTMDIGEKEYCGRPDEQPKLSQPNRMITSSSNVQENM